MRARIYKQPIYIVCILYEGFHCVHKPLISSTVGLFGSGGKCKLYEIKGALVRAKLEESGRNGRRLCADMRQTPPDMKALMRS